MDKDDDPIMDGKDDEEDSQKLLVSSNSSSYQGISYNAALVKTIYTKPKSPPLSSYKRIWIKCCCGCIFQVVLIGMFMVLSQLTSPLVNGLSFLEKEPKHFECKDSSTGEWKPCTKEEICDRGLSKDEYRADTNDDEYFDNWVEKYDLLCESKFKIGLIGSMGFIGIITTLLILPPLADKYGRKWVFIISNIVAIISQFGLIVSDNIWELYFFSFLLGTTFAGKIIVGLNYMLEYNLPKFHQTVIYLLLCAESISTILMTVWYQFIDRGWFLLQLICLILAIIVTTYYGVFVPESPKWLYTWNRFSQSRENLRYVASYNGLPENKQNRIMRINFDLQNLEKAKSELMEKNSDMMSLMEVNSKISKRKQIISDNQYIANIVILTIMWTVSSFSFYLLLFMNKYYEGSIYLNYYLDGVAGIVGSSLSLLTYGCLRMRWAFVISLTLTLLATIGILIYQQGYASPHWIQVFFPADQKSPYEEDSEDDRQYYLGYLVPAIVFIAKVGVNMTFQNTYQASFGENLIFPFYKRATAIGICNFIARTVTITSSLAAELDRPWPAILLISLTVISLVNAFFLPSMTEEIEYEKKMKELDADQEEDMKGKED